MVEADGRVFDKTFLSDHRTRESVHNLMQKSFSIDDPERGESRFFKSADLEGRAYFASPTIRSSQLTMLTVEISIAEGLHINGPSVPDGYIPLDLIIDENEAVVLEQVQYPEPQETYIEVLEESLPTFSGQIEIKALCKGVRKRTEEPTNLCARLTYQACDDRQCYLPQELPLPLSLQVLPHVR